MMNGINRFYISLFLLCFVIWCKKAEPKKQTDLENAQPVVSEDGKTIEFLKDSPHLKIFLTTEAKNLDIDIDLEASATVIGKVKEARGRGLPPVILFASPELTQTYSAYLQNLSTIQIAKKNLSRTKDLFEHGASTGKELSDVSGELYNKESNLAEHEAKLRREGFSPESMQNAKTGTIWLIADLPETELNIIAKKIKCSLTFPGYPGEHFEAIAETISEVLNIETRKARVRLVMQDNESKIRPGMFGKVNFRLKESGLMVPKQSVFTSNAKYYVFVKKGENVFEKREVTISTEGDEYIEIHQGIGEGEIVVSKNVMLLKGILFGI
ncbi:MAG: efflux RND transporter periplasmic adaptor subunit [Leptospiraceae bacterium]|nr:efflux RND transporter periplasmic adaptor subunit [Leptospiraceae bacterium]MCP5496119.1 efflux RND transporter periplasmic adaptor subunit [Leptospiraceae bacterium]